jgi:hypothetical protein
LIPQYSAHGLLLASGIANWDTDEDGVGFYNFTQDQSLKWRIHPQLIRKMDIIEDDLLDCVEQIEDQITPDEFDLLGPKNGFAKGFGVLRPGIKVRSELNDNILCVFTPVSNEYDDVCGYFEWYYAPDSEKATPENIQNRMDAVVGSKAYRTFSSPIYNIPSYEEAMLKAGPVLKENADKFGALVWEYHHTHLRGIKDELGAIILKEWKHIVEAQDAAIADQKFGPESVVQAILQDNLYKITKVEADDGQARYYVIPPLSGQDLIFLQQKVSALIGNRFAVDFNKNGTVIEMIDLMPEQVIESWEPDREALIEVKKKQKQVRPSRM